jgi:polar amino acid transport system substrate-binding protein
MFSWMKIKYRAWSLLCLFVMAVPSAVAETRLLLSEAEKAWLSQTDAIRVCTDPDWMPYEGIDEQARHTGIMSDFHQLWSGMIDKPIALQRTNSWEQSLQFMEQGKCDVLSSAHDVPSRRHYLTVTEPFIFYPFAVATHPDNHFIIDLLPLIDQHFVMVKGYAGVEIMRKRYPALDLELVDSAREGLMMVEKGNAYGFIDTVPSINYQTLKHGVSLIKINGVLDEHYAMSVGIRKDLPELLSIYNKAIAATRDADRQHILNNWLSLTFEYPFDYSLLWKGLIGLTIVLGLFFYHYFMVNRHNRELQQVNRQLEELSHRDHLTGIPNRYYLQLRFDAELKRFQRYRQVFSVLIMDIDHFKRINDSYGHVIGDETLKRIARLLADNIRDSDVVGRWGGEEFMILCPETDTKGGRALAEHLRQSISQTDFSLDRMEITVSFGVTDYRDDELLEETIKRADQALYQAKHEGRNRTVVF